MRRPRTNLILSILVPGIKYQFLAPSILAKLLSVILIQIQTIFRLRFVDLNDPQRCLGAGFASTLPWVRNNFIANLLILMHLPSGRAETKSKLCLQKLVLFVV